MPQIYSPRACNKCNKKRFNGKSENRLLPVNPANRKGSKLPKLTRNQQLRENNRQLIMYKPVNRNSKLASPVDSNLLAV